MSQEARFAQTLAAEAGVILRERLEDFHERSMKGRTNFKIAVDDELDALARRAIDNRYPEHSINSEEAADKEMTSSEFTWLVDPLDGTIPYTLQASHHAAFSIALAEYGVPITGAINVALERKVFVAETGRGAYRNNLLIQTGEGVELNSAVIGIDYGKISRLKSLLILEKLLNPDGITYPVSYGGSAASLMAVVEGRLDGYLSHEIEPWDVAAAVCICQEAGLQVTDLRGGSWNITSPSILVAPPKLHEQLLDHLTN